MICEWNRAATSVIGTFNVIAECQGNELNVNAAIHHYEPVRIVLGYLDIPIIYLPPYCCFLNPIEHIFFSVKAAIRRHRQAMCDDLVGTLSAILRGMKHYNMRELMRRMGYHRVCR